MLIDLPPLHPRGRFAAVAAVLGMGDPERLASGVYRAGFDFNFRHDLDACGYTVNYFPFSDLWKEVFAAGPDSDREAARQAALDAPADYGVCDHWEQIIERWPQIVSSPRRFVIGLTEVRREDESEGGWRWHKWGEYIGTFEHQREYLYDEVGIDSVWTFEIVEVLDGPGGWARGSGNDG